MNTFESMLLVRRAALGAALVLAVSAAQAAGLQDGGLAWPDVLSTGLGTLGWLWPGNWF